MKRGTGIFQLMRYMRSHPSPQPVKCLAAGVGCHIRQIQDWLPQLEVKVKRGRDPVNNRKNVKLYSIVLPSEKAAALTQGAKS